MLRGRAFTERDDGAAPGVAMINEAMAKQYWPKGDPLTDRILIGPGAGPAFAEPSRQIDRHRRRYARWWPGSGSNRPIMYIPLAQMPDLETALNSRVTPLWWVVRTQVEPHSLTAPITAALREASGGLPVAHIRTMNEIEALNTARQRFNMLLLIVFGSAGLLMAAIGVYGVMSYSVQQRTQELGVRMALGAQASNLRNMIIGQGMMLARHRRGAGHWRGVLADAISGELFVWGKGVGSDGVYRDAGAAGRGGSAGGLGSGAAGDEG